MERRWEMRIGNFDQKKKILFVEFLQIGEHELNLA